VIIGTKSIVFILLMMLVLPDKVVAGRSKPVHHNLMGEIIKLAEKSQKLDNEILKLRRFKLCREQPALRGDNQKFLLESEDGEFWLFKTSSNSKRFRISEAVYQFAVLCGLRQIPTYVVSLPINGRMINGSLQKFYENSYTLEALKNIPLGKWPKGYLEYIEKGIIFDWLIGDYDEGDFEEFIVDKKTNVIYRVDRDDAFNDSFENEEMTLSFFQTIFNEEKKEINVFHAWMDATRSGEATPGPSLYEFIAHIKGIPKYKLNKTFSWPFRLMQDEEGIYSTKILFNKIGKLDQDVARFLKELTGKEAWQDTKLYISNENNYTREVYSKLKKRVKWQLILKEKLKSKNPKRQLSISVIASPEAWALTYNCGERIEDERMTAEEAKVLKEELINKLMLLKKNTQDRNEKYAISMYISIMKKDDFDTFFKNRVAITLHPDDIITDR